MEITIFLNIHSNLQIQENSDSICTKRVKPEEPEYLQSGPLDNYIGDLSRTLKWKI